MAEKITIPAYMSYAQLEKAYTKTGVGEDLQRLDVYEHSMVFTIPYNKLKTKILALREFMQEAGLVHASRVWFERNDMYVEFDESCWDKYHHSNMSDEELAD